MYSKLRLLSKIVISDAVGTVFDTRYRACVPDRGVGEQVSAMSSSRKLGGKGRHSKPLPPPKIRDIDYFVTRSFSRLLRDEQRHDQELMSNIEMTLSEQIRMLSRADFLEPLSEQQLEKLAARCPDIFYKKGEILSIPRPNEEGFFYIVKQGRVRVYELGPGGHEHTLTEIWDGTAFAYSIPIESRSRVLTLVKWGTRQSACAGGSVISGQ